MAAAPGRGGGKGDERRLAGSDYRTNAVLLVDGKRDTVAWNPEAIGGRRAGSKLYRAEEIDWARNNAGLSPVDNRTAEALAVRESRATFRLEDGRTLRLRSDDPQLRPLDPVRAPTVHAFQGHTVNNGIAAIDARIRHERHRRYRPERRDVRRRRNRRAPSTAVATTARCLRDSRRRVQRAAVQASGDGVAQRCSSAGQSLFP